MLKDRTVGKRTEWGVADIIQGIQQGVLIARLVAPNVLDHSECLRVPQITLVKRRAYVHQG